MQSNKFVLLETPADFKQVYDALLNRLSDYGVDLLKDCRASCKGEGRSTIHCWNMFQSACAAYALGEYKKSRTLINYIIKKCKFDIKPFSDRIFTFNCDGNLNITNAVGDAVLITLEIVVDNGGAKVFNSFENVKLIPVIKRNGVEIPEREYDELDFVWSRASSEGDDDTEWNAQSRTKKRILTLTSKDVEDEYSVLSVKVIYEGNELKGTM